MALKNAAPHLPMVGYYQVDILKLHQQQRFSLKSDGLLWEMVAITGNVPYNLGNDVLPHIPGRLYYTLHARTVTTSLKNYFLRIKLIDADHGAFYLTQCSDADYNCFFPKTNSTTGILRYVVFHDTGHNGTETSPKPTVLDVAGTVDGALVTMRLRRFERSPFVLERSTMHLIVPDDFRWL